MHRRARVRRTSAGEAGAHQPRFWKTVLTAHVRHSHAELVDEEVCPINFGRSSVIVEGCTRAALIFCTRVVARDDWHNKYMLGKCAHDAQRREDRSRLCSTRKCEKACHMFGIY